MADHGRNGVSKRTKAEPGGETASPALSSPERSELQRQGAKAAARGDAARSNPMARPENDPESTGEAVDAWSQRSHAWQEGHDAQTAQTGKIDRAGPRPGDDDGRE